MTKWLHSGRRRDTCAILYDAGELRPQQLKHRLTSHYDERIDPQSFRAMLAALENAGFVTSRTEGIADLYRLTDAGERALLEHYDWLAERIEGDDGDGGGVDSAGDGGDVDSAGDEGDVDGSGKRGP
ncbi:PadR family transcriptional regulator [Haloparvum sp. AD34]